MSEEVQESKEIVLSQSYEVQKISFPATEELIKKVEDDFAEIPSDLTVKENYTFIKDGVRSVGKLISGTETHRKFLKKAPLEYGRRVDAAAKEIEGRLRAIHTPMKEAKTEFDTKAEIEKREAEQKEIKRKDIIGEKISGIQGLLSENIMSNSILLTETIQILNRDEVSIWADEFTEEAQLAKTETLEKLRELLIMKSQAELAEKLEKEREQKELEAQKALMVETARLAEANRKQACALKAAQEKLAAEQAAVEKEKLALQEKVEADKLATERRLEKEEREQEAKAEKEKIERVEKIFKEQKRIEEEAQKKIEKEEAEEKAKAEKLATEQKLEKEKLEKEKLEKEKLEKEAREKAKKEAIEKLATETLQEDMDEAVQGLIAYCNTKKRALCLVNGIRENKFKNIKWV